MRTARADLAVGVAATAVLWAIAIVPAYTFFEWPRQIDTLNLVGVLRIAAILGLVAGIARFPQPAFRLALILATAWLLWCPLTAWPSIVGWLVANHGSGAACRGTCVRCASLLGLGHGGVPGWLDLAIVGSAFAAAVWWRPRALAADGPTRRRTLAVRYAALLCLVGGPVGGLAAFLALAPGDVYGGPFGLGVLIGLFGLLSFTGHAAFDGLLGRPNLSAAMSPAYAAVVILAPVAYAAMAGTLRLTH
ncbi:MAG: hypothetical protein ACYDAN_09445 [Candidatus Limnocylindrales bacterium]